MHPEITIKISDEIAKAAPDLCVLKLEARVVNKSTDASVISLLRELEKEIRERFPEMSLINKQPGIAGTRDAYKACGKDPNRYRPSQEQLTRRIVSGKELYSVSTVVDVCNYVSVLSGYSIGAFDINKIDGDTLVLGIGRKDEPYEGIGRGTLNIEGLPVYRDNIGGVGTPTSDNERTKLTEDTTKLLVCVNIYRVGMSADTVRELLTTLLCKYCDASDITTSVITAH